MIFQNDKSEFIEMDEKDEKSSFFKGNCQILNRENTQYVVKSYDRPQFDNLKSYCAWLE